jgi:hypothetical protein
MATRAEHMRRVASANVGSRNPRFKHGLSGTSEHVIWLGMLDRCYNVNGDAYDHYGGRGIVVCDRWRSSFIDFLQDMGPRPKGRSLDRIDNDGPYSPDNCRWATPQQQAENRRMTRWLEWNGERHTISEWARRLGICRTAINQRLKRGWTLQRALSQETACE